MARQSLIGTFGKFRAPGVSTGESEVLNRLAGPSSQVQDIAFGIGAEQAAEEGRLAGLQAVEREGGQVKTPEIEDPGLSIRQKAFNEASILAHRAAIQTDSKNRLDELQREEALDPEKFELRARAYRDGLTSDMPEELAVLVGSDIDSSIASRKSKLDGEFFQRIEAENIATLNEGLETFRDDILNATREGDLARVEKLTIEANAMLDQAVDSAILDPSKANQIKEDIRERVTEQNTLREIEDVIFADELSLEQKVEKGINFVNDLRQRELKDLSPEQKDSLIRVVGGKVGDLQTQIVQEQSAKNIETERSVSNLKLAAKQGFDSLQNIIERTEEAFNRGDITGNERTSILNDAFNGNKAKQKQAQDFSLVAQKLTGNFPEIVLQQKTIDDYYQQIEMPRLEGQPPEVKSAAQAAFVSELKAVPNQIKKEINNNILSGEPELIVQSADLINRIDEIPGLADLAVNANQRAFVENVVDLSVTMEPEQAVKLARELSDPRDKARVEAKEQEIKSEKMQEDYEGWVEDGFEGFFGANFLVDNVNKQAVEAEFKTNFEAFFKAGMTKDRAKEKSIELLQRNWKESQFGFMKHPPEQYYQVGANTEYMKDQLASDITKGFVGIEFEKDNLFLLSDELTGRQAAQGKPTYRVMVLDNNGEVQMLNKRWSPDIEKEQQRQLKVNEGKAQKLRTGQDPFEVTRKTSLGQFFESVLKDAE